MSDPAVVAVGISIAGFLVQSGLVAWGVWSVRKIAKEEVDLAKKETAIAMEKHDRDPVAHPNHHMTPIIQALQIEITRTLSRLEGRMENVSNEMASLRKAHDDAVSRGSCLYQQLDDKRGDR